MTCDASFRSRQMSTVKILLTGVSVTVKGLYLFFLHKILVIESQRTASIIRDQTFLSMHISQRCWHCISIYPRNVWCSAVIPHIFCDKTSISLHWNRLHFRLLTSASINKHLQGHDSCQEIKWSSIDRCSILFSSASSDSRDTRRLHFQFACRTVDCKSLALH